MGPDGLAVNLRKSPVQDTRGQSWGLSLEIQTGNQQDKDTNAVNGTRVQLEYLKRYQGSCQNKANKRNDEADLLLLIIDYWLNSKLLC